ncbi:Copper transport protein [Aphelenchoides fujianensis]|nr:Copper transport protein [Aphelenchoides fujianensis]
MSHDAHAHHHDHSAPTGALADGGDHHTMSGHAMAFHFKVQEVILFNFWDVQTPLGLLLSCFAVFVGCCFLEGIRWFRMHRANVRLTAPTEGEEGPRKRLDRWILTDTLLHGIQLVLAYFAMLIFMTLNVWLCLAVVIGEVGAHLVLRLFFPHLDSLNNPVSFARPCCS